MQLFRRRFTQLCALGLFGLAGCAGPGEEDGREGGEDGGDEDEMGGEEDGEADDEEE
jgi:hypothetical protein